MTKRKTSPTAAQWTKLQLLDHKEENNVDVRLPSGLFDNGYYEKNCTNTTYCPWRGREKRFIQDLMQADPQFVRRSFHTISTDRWTYAKN